MRQRARFELEVQQLVVRAMRQRVRRSMTKERLEIHRVQEVQEKAQHQRTRGTHEARLELEPQRRVHQVQGRTKHAQEWSVSKVESVHSAETQHAQVEIRENRQSG